MEYGKINDVQGQAAGEVINHQVHPFLTKPGRILIIYKNKPKTVIAWDFDKIYINDDILQTELRMVKSSKTIHISEMEKIEIRTR